ncbi:MAG: sulfotransferase [Clostridiaceae bacterium]|nr:sulfotransferase [Clostridiaceae bacterium]
MLLTTTEQLLAEANKQQSVIIFGTGLVARTVIRFLQKQEISVAGIAGMSGRDKTMFGFTVRHLRDFSDQAEKALVLLCERSDVLDEYRLQAEQSGFPSVASVDYNLYVELSVAENMHLDFMCAGFSKSGTTSLHTALKKHPSVVLPKTKESYYMHWREQYDNAPERFFEKYFGVVPEGMLAGDIEPSYHRIASEIGECFGTDLKIILMMRNPIDATFSNFKMLMKNPTEIRQIFYYIRHNKYHADMFDNYLRDYIYSGKDTRYQYSAYVRQFIDVFGSENVKLVIFEELISDTTRVMDEIQEFIGVPRKKYSKFPKSNTGGKVSKNFFCMGINFLLYRKRLKLKSASQEQRKKFGKKYDAWHQKTLVESDGKMTEDSRNALRDFYRSSVSELSVLAQRDFSQWWKDFK